MCAPALGCPEMNSITAVSGVVFFFYMMEQSNNDMALSRLSNEPSLSVFHSSLSIVFMVWDAFKIIVCGVAGWGGGDVVTTIMLSLGPSVWGLSILARAEMLTSYVMSPRWQTLPAPVKCANPYACWENIGSTILRYGDMAHQGSVH